MPPALPWILFAFSVVAAVFALLQTASARKGSGRERELRAQREQELETLRSEVAKRERRGNENASELQELRKRLEKTKRRAFEAREEADPLRQRVSGLEAELRGKESALRDRDESLARVETLLAKVTAEREAARNEAQRADAEASDKASADAEAERAERETLGKKVNALETKVADAEREAGRYRQRYRTSQRLYTVIRSELEVTKDRVRELEGKPPRAATAAPPPPIEEEPEEKVESALS